MPNAIIMTVSNVDYDLKDENGRLGTASEFSTSSNYVIGDYCWYEDKLYRFTANHSSSTWVAAHATEVKIADEIKTASFEGDNRHPFESKWILGKTIGNTGTYTSNSYSAVTPMFYDANDKYTYTGASKDSSNISFFVYVHEYDSGFNWLNRHSIDMSSIPATFSKQDASCVYYRFVFGRSSSTGVVFTEADLSYFSMTVVMDKSSEILVKPNPVAVNTDGTVNAVYSLAEEYLNYAYTGDNISGIIYHTETSADAASPYSPTVTPVQVVGDIKQYTIQCSGFVNLLLRAVSFANSRYEIATNVSQPWGYDFDDISNLKDPSYGNIVWSFKLLKYADEHGFSFVINDEGTNVKAGDVLFTVTPTSTNYKGITHVAMVLACGDDGTCVVAEARDTTRTSGGVDYPVGLVLNKVDLKGNTSVLYAARFPLGDVDQSSEYLYKDNPSLSGSSVADALIGATHVIDVPKGLYTLVVRGKFSSAPVAKIRYTGTSGYVSVGTMIQSGNIFTLPIYADAPVQYVALYAPEGGTTYTDYDYFALYHGYANPNIVGETIQEAEDYNKIGYYLKSGQDLDSLDVGRYVASTNAIAASLSNCPTSVTFVLDCVAKSRTTKSQIIYSSNGNIYARHSTSSGYGSWYQYTGTAV